MIDRSPSPSRRAFTLLEVLLTLSMSVVLMALIGSAIQFYARDLDVSDMDVRQTQLAAAVLQMIEDDLRSTIYGKPADMDDLAELLSAAGSMTGAATGGGGGEEETTDMSAAGIDSDEELMLEDDLLLEPPDLTSGVAILQEPGLIGNQYQIQIDVSRMPRLEEYVQMLDETPTDLQDVPSDIKTVGYYVQGVDVATGVQDSLAKLNSDNSAVGGLVRRSLDRAATTYAASTGGIGALSQTGDLLAPEVASIEFEYFDGTTWLLEWSSDESSGLPLAVRVRLTMNNPLASASGQSVEDADTLRVFTHIVRLPMAKLIELEEETEEELSEAGI